MERSRVWVLSCDVGIWDGAHREDRSWAVKAVRSVKRGGVSWCCFRFAGRFSPITPNPKGEKKHRMQAPQ